MSFIAKRNRIWLLNGKMTVPFVWQRPSAISREPHQQSTFNWRIKTTYPTYTFSSNTFNCAYDLAVTLGVPKTNNKNAAKEKGRRMH